MADYLIGDTIQFKASIKNLAGALTNPAEEPTVEVFDLDGIALLSTGVSSLTAGTTGKYYCDWKVSTGLTADANLLVVWSWDDKHKARMSFSVITVLS